MSRASEGIYYKRFIFFKKTLSQLKQSYSQKTIVNHDKIKNKKWSNVTVFLHNKDKQHKTTCTDTDQQMLLHHGPFGPATDPLVKDRRRSHGKHNRITELRITLGSFGFIRIVSVEHYLFVRVNFTIRLFDLPNSTQALQTNFYRKI